MREVTAVTRNSQATQSGILQGDIITRMGTIDISNIGDLTKVMNAHNVGDVVDVGLIRRNEHLTSRRRLIRRRWLSAALVVYTSG
jgi:S1-C subfamily serine protease